MSGRRRAVVLANAWHDDNKGDSAITLATVAMLRRRHPDAEIRLTSLLDGDDPRFADAYRHVCAEHPDAVVMGSPCPAPPPSARSVQVLVRWVIGVAMAYGRGRRGGAARPAFLDGATLVVMQGGSNVFDSGLGFVRLAQVLFPAWAAQRAGVPTVFLGHTLGPFPRGPSRWFVRRVLARSRAVVVREEQSVALAERLGVSAPVLQGPDLAFGLDPAHTDRVGHLLTTHGLLDGCFAVFVVRRHPYLSGDAGRRLVETLASAAHTLRRGGVVAQVAVVAHTCGPTELEDDREISAQLAAAIGDGTPVVDADLPPPELAALYGHAAVVVSVRLHGSLLSLVGGTPTFAISYFTAKTDGVMEAIGMSDQVASYEAGDGERIVEQVRGLVGPAGRERARAAAAQSRLDLEAVSAVLA
ncbi:MAG: polysaccharide pyruvyl transferase family protein [Acidimicrobiales bacterium]